MLPNKNFQLVHQPKPNLMLKKVTILLTETPPNWPKYGKIDQQWHTNQCSICYVNYPYELRMKVDQIVHGTFPNVSYFLG